MAKSLCLLTTGTILSIILIVLGEAIVPDMLIKGLHDKLKSDSQSKINEWIEPNWGARTPAAPPTHRAGSLTLAPAAPCAVQTTTSRSPSRSTT